jgi:hypothetical protein
VSQNEIIPIDESGVRGLLHTPMVANGDALALTHGAGANCQAPLLVALAREFCASGTSVLRYDLPFRQQRPHGPPLRGSDKRDREGIAAAIAFLRQQPSTRIFAGGHSYGGRQTSMLLAEQPGLVDGLLLLAYPLHPPKKPEQLRTAHLPDLRTPALFVSGSRDGFGTLAELAEALKLIPARTMLLPIEGAGHELLSKKNVEELPKKIAAAFAEMFQPRSVNG